MPSSIPVFGVNVAVTDMLMFVLSLSSLLILLFILYRTKIGLGIRAACYDVNTVQLMGMNPDFLVTVALMMSGALGGISGVFLGLNYSLFPQLGQMVVKGFVASVLGGLGSIWGAVAGAVLAAGLWLAARWSVPFLAGMAALRDEAALGILIVAGALIYGGCIWLLFGRRLLVTLMRP